MAFASVPGSTIAASLPPSSSVRRARLPADASMILRPVSVEPVNITLAMSGCPARRPPMAPGPVTGTRTSAGSTSLMTEVSASTLRGVLLLGLSTAVFPMRSAGPICQIEIISGQFHGLIAPTTPAAL